jgi:hypothetical protein
MTDGAVSLEDLLAEPGNVSAFPIDASAFRYKPLYFPKRPFSTASLIREAVERHGLALRTGYEARKVVFSGPSRVAAVEGVGSGTGLGERVEADLFVLASGGVGTPKILLRSAANSQNLQQLPVGEFLTDHPTGFVFKAKLRSRHDFRSLFGSRWSADGSFSRRFGFVLADPALRESSGRNHVVYLRPAFTLKDPGGYSELKKRLVAYRGRRLTMSDVIGLLKHADLFAEALNFRFGLFKRVRHVAGFVFAEQLPGEDNRISLNDDGQVVVRWQISAVDASSLRSFLDLFLTRHEHLFERVAVFPHFLGSGAHHSGACRMASSREEGVVGSDLKVFGTDNLYIADGSILPYTGHANTGLTIAAFALKCVDEIRARLSASLERVTKAHASFDRVR